MIKLKKEDEPKKLRENAAAWTAVIEAKYAAGDKPTPTEMSRYRHPEIKDVLVKETNGKCAYCESKLLHIHHGDVEHIYPKSLDRKMTFEWSNLTLACEVCNQLKSDKDPLIKQILDPYSVDPAQHITLFGVVPKGKTPQGVSTVDLLKLYRAELLEQRDQELERIYGIIYQITDARIAIESRRSMYKNLLDESLAGTGAYSAMIRAVLRVETDTFDPEITSCKIG